MAMAFNQSAVSFDLRLPAKVVFGWGRRTSIASLVAPLGKRAWLLCGSRTLKKAGVPDEIERLLTAAGIETLRVNCMSREPETSDVDQAVDAIRKHLQEGDCLIGLGGGATIDLAKAVAGLVTQPEAAPVKDYLEGVGRGLTLSAAPLPFIAMPTTSGTGSEATKNAVISSYDPPFKKSLRDERLVPAAVLIDPELTVTNPREVTAYSGMDALTQLIESYLTRKATPLTKALALEGLKVGFPALKVAVEEPTNRQAREAMSYAAWLSGVTLANSGLGFAHGVAAALGVHCRVPHGLACAVLLGPALQLNRTSSTQDLAELAQAVLPGQSFATPEAAAEAFISAVSQLAVAIGIPARLRDLGVRSEELPVLVPASRGNSMSGNPRDVSDEELLQVLTGLW